MFDLTRLNLTTKLYSVWPAAWPQIEELHLAAYDRLHPCGTLLGLHAFARHCPNPHTLELSFDASSVPPPHPDPCLRQKLWHPALERLDVAYSLISNAFDVSRFISATYFSVAELSTALEGADLEDAENTDPRFPAQVVCHKLWEKVEIFLPGLNDIRAEEYHWVNKTMITIISRANLMRSGHPNLAGMSLFFA
ncbi:hypothetical protein B0H14DRAFT_3662840 [Mycena olivaceomarginata]|nr:hypothetical protein B0H14DRAFT_3662840 [Mycena olivaceomarginata]